MRVFGFIVRANKRALDFDLSSLMPIFLKAISHRYLHLALRPVLRTLALTLEEPISKQSNLLANVLARFFAYTTRFADAFEKQKQEETNNALLDFAIQTLSESKQKINE